MIQSYIYILKTREKLQKSFSAAMVNIFSWITFYTLVLVKLYVSFFFYTPVNKDPDSDVTVAGRKPSAVHEYMYLRILLDSQLTFKSQVKKSSEQNPTQCGRFRHIRNNLTTVLPAILRQVGSPSNQMKDEGFENTGQKVKFIPSL